MSYMTEQEKVEYTQYLEELQAQALKEEDYDKAGEIQKVLDEIWMYQ